MLSLSAKGGPKSAFPQPKSIQALKESLLQGLMLYTHYIACRLPHSAIWTESSASSISVTAPIRRMFFSSTFLAFRR